MFGFSYIIYVYFITFFRNDQKVRALWRGFWLVRSAATIFAHYHEIVPLDFEAGQAVASGDVRDARQGGCTVAVGLAAMVGGHVRSGMVGARTRGRKRVGA